MHIVSSCSVYSIILWCKLYVLWCIFYNIEMYIYCIYCDVYLDPVHTGLYMGEIFFLEYICGCVHGYIIPWIHLYPEYYILTRLSLHTWGRFPLWLCPCLYCWSWRTDTNTSYILLCGSEVGDGSEEIQYLKNVAGYGSSIKSRSHMS